MIKHENRSSATERFHQPTKGMDRHLPPIHQQKRARIQLVG